LNHRWRVSRQRDHWLAKISEAIERQSVEDQEPPRAEFADYVRELQRIALGQDPSGSARDRLAALKELLKLEKKGHDELILPRRDLSRARVIRRQSTRREIGRRPLLGGRAADPPLSSA
jgi:hypothetical protein